MGAATFQHRGVLYAMGAAALQHRGVLCAVGVAALQHRGVLYAAGVAAFQHRGVLYAMMGRKACSTWNVMHRAIGGTDFRRGAARLWFEGVPSTIHLEVPSKIIHGQIGLESGAASVGISR